jgi:hypothetical protein
MVQNESNLIMNNTNSSLHGTEGSRMVNSGEELPRNEALLEAEAAGAEPSSQDSDDSTELLIMSQEISDLNPHDVLLGRGTGPSDYIGNRAFRALCDDRKEQYTSLNQYKPKAAIAKQIFDIITERGGRFLKQVEHEDGKVRNEDDQKYVQVDKKTALEKCKQALREQKKSAEKGKKKDAAVAPTENQRTGSVAAAVAPPGLSATNLLGTASPFSGMGTVPGPTLGFPFGGPQPFVVPMMPLMVAASPFFMALEQQQQQMMLQQQLAANLSQSVQIHQQGLQANGPSATMSLHATGTPFFGVQNDPATRRIVDAMIQACQLGRAYNQTQTSVSMQPEEKIGGFKRRQDSDVDSIVHSSGGCSPLTTAGGRCSSPSIESQSSLMDAYAPSLDVAEEKSNEEDAAYSLSFLSLSDQPRFTEEQIELERLTMTDEERAAVLVDTFGKLCKMNRHKRKKARRDLDKESIEFLVKRMRNEIDAIHNEQKTALLNAREKCRPQEFSDARLLLFLRCVGMNAKDAAERFVRYWEGRREVFGNDKYVLPMTLSEALKDDLAAIEAGVYLPLPKKDLSGRSMMYLEPHRNTGKGYSSESLLRAFWFAMEVSSQSNTDINAGVCQIIWDKGSSPFDFDRYAWQGYISHLTHSWPMKPTAIHACCTPSFVIRIIKPILFYFMDREGRARVIFHGPESEVPNSLSSYGILRDTIPAHMGGTLEYDPSLWIANRRAVELEMEEL